MHKAVNSRRVSVTSPSLDEEAGASLAVQARLCNPGMCKARCKEPGRVQVQVVILGERARHCRPRTLFP